MRDIILDIANQAAKSMIAKKDAVIWNAISAQIGADWSVQELFGRVERVVVSHSGVETFYLDGNPLVEFYPADPIVNCRDHSNYVGFGQKYRLLSQVKEAS